MKKHTHSRFSILELIIVIAIMTILSAMIFVLTNATKDASNSIKTNSIINSCKISIEYVNEFIANESRSNSIEIYQHPLFTKVWPSNKVWTFRDKNESDNGFTANGLRDMINIGNLGIENNSIAVAEMKFPDGIITKTLVDGWGNPILLMRNQIAWEIKKLNPSDNKTEKVYFDRTKSNLSQYLKVFNTNLPGLGLYEWNDASFNHLNGSAVLESSYEVAPKGADGYKNVVINGKIAVPHNTNDFDFFSPGKDGKVGNLIPRDNNQDRWSEIKDNTGALKWIKATIPGTDPDDDNFASFNKFNAE